MSESPLRTLSVDFAVQILNLVKMLKSRHETIVSNQIGRRDQLLHTVPAWRSASQVVPEMTACTATIFRIRNVMKYPLAYGSFF